MIESSAPYSFTGLTDLAESRNQHKEGKELLLVYAEWNGENGGPSVLCQCYKIQTCLCWMAFLEFLGRLVPKEMQLLKINILSWNKSNRSVYSVSSDSSPWRDLEETPAPPKIVPGRDTNRWRCEEGEIYSEDWIEISYWFMKTFLFGVRGKGLSLNFRWGWATLGGQAKEASVRGLFHWPSCSPTGRRIFEK